jgi:hypothetical protein
MTEASGLNLSVAGFFAKRNARRRSNQEAAEQLHQALVRSWRERADVFLRGARLAADHAGRSPQGARVLETEPEAGRYRPVFHLAEERPGSISMEALGGEFV